MDHDVKVNLHWYVDSWEIIQTALETVYSKSALITKSGRMVITSHWAADDNLYMPSHAARCLMITTRTWCLIVSQTLTTESTLCPIKNDTFNLLYWQVQTCTKFNITWRIWVNLSKFCINALLLCKINKNFDFCKMQSTCYNTCTALMNDVCVLITNKQNVVKRGQYFNRRVEKDMVWENKRVNCFR